jgi:hypothetical protein
MGQGIGNILSGGGDVEKAINKAINAVRSKRNQDHELVKQDDRRRNWKLAFIFL